MSDDLDPSRGVLLGIVIAAGLWVTCCIVGLLFAVALTARW